jgi:pSer/pThr/pTyr-binding forkhead associated (FHA) protein
MPRLVIKQGPGIGRDFNLGPMACIVGRDPAVDFRLEDRLSSRRHFRVRLQGGTYVVEDLGSTNGTRLNGRRVEQSGLCDGDRISVGETEILFIQKDLLQRGPASQGRRRGR